MLNKSSLRRLGDKTRPRTFRGASRDLKVRSPSSPTTFPSPTNTRNTKHYKSPHTIRREHDTYFTRLNDRFVTVFECIQWPRLIAAEEGV